jgi:hypothetical protein
VERAGASIGSCGSWLAFIHYERLEAGVFNISNFFRRLRQ